MLSREATNTNLIVLGLTRLQGRIQGGPPDAHPPKIWKNKIFWHKIVIFHTKYPKNFHSSLRNWKKYDFLTWNRDFSHEKAQKFWRLPPLGANFLSAHPPLTWNPGSARGSSLEPMIYRCSSICDWLDQNITITNVHTCTISDYVCFNEEKSTCSTLQG